MINCNIFIQNMFKFGLLDCFHFLFLLLLDLLLYFFVFKLGEAAHNDSKNQIENEVWAKDDKHEVVGYAKYDVSGLDQSEHL